MSRTISVVTDDSFENTISHGVSIVYFWADWCGPCKKFEPLVEDLAEKFNGRVAVLKMDVESEKKTHVRLMIDSVPSIVIFKDGKMVGNQFIGISNIERVAPDIDKLL